MENKKDIGKAFREKLDGLQKPAPDGGWDSISSRLGQIKKPSKFPWLRTTIISLAVVCVVVVATYLLWGKYLTQFYMVIPENNAKENAVNTSSNENPENGGPAGNTIGNQRNDTAVSIKNNSHFPDKPNSGSTVATTIRKADQKQDSAISYQSTVDGKSHNQATTESTAPALPLKQNSITAPETNPGKATDTDNYMPDNRRGKLKDPTDYGADSLVIGKKPEKRDLSKIADSLNKLYGREKKEKKKKN